MLNANNTIQSFRLKGYNKLSDWKNKLAKGFHHFSFIGKGALTRVGLKVAALSTIVAPASAADINGINEFTRGIVALGSALFGLAILWGAARIMAASGDQKLMDEGKNVVKNAVIGYIILIIASVVPQLAGHVEIEPLVLVPP